MARLTTSVRVRARVLPAAVMLAVAALALSACGGNSDTSATGATPSGSAATAPSAPQIRCLRITDSQAKQILGIPGPFGPSTEAKYPCPAFWASPVKWEQRKGPDSLHGTISDAAVTLEYIDFPNRATAMDEYQALYKGSVKNQIDKFGDKRNDVSTLNSSGDAEAYLDVPEQSLLADAYGSQFASSVVGRCGARLLRLNASKDTFYSAIMDGHSPTEENIVQRSRLPISVQKELKKGYALLGEPVCAGDELPSILIGPYTRP